MLTDPAALTYNSGAISLARGAGDFPGVGKRSSHSHYRTSSGEFELGVSHSFLGGGAIRSEVILSRNDTDAGSNPFPGLPLTFNRFGLIYDINVMHQETATDIPLLRTALLAFVDTTLQNRIIGGEM